MAVSVMIATPRPANPNSATSRDTTVWDRIGNRLDPAGNTAVVVRSV
jgi:hypothetical protein